MKPFFQLTKKSIKFNKLCILTIWHRNCNVKYQERRWIMGKKLFGLCLATALVVGLGMAGCKGPKGDKGDTGEPGTPGTAAVDKGNISGTVTDASTGNGISGATVVTGSFSTTTDTTGKFTLSNIPVGVYKLTASAQGYNSAESDFVGVAAGQTSEVNFALSAVQAPNQAPTVSLASQYQVGFGKVVTLNATASDPDGDPVTCTWSQTGGPAITITPSGCSATFTTKALTDLNTLEDRFGIVGITPESQGSYSIKVTVSDGKGGSASVTSTVTSASVSAGIRNIPVGIAIYLNSGHDDPNSWTCTFNSNPCSSSVFSGENTRTPRFQPNTEGQYTIAEGTNSMVISVASWNGVIGAESSCTMCHNNSIAPDKFTPWASTGHANIFAEGIDGLLEGGYYSTSCLKCHTVGYDPSANNGGFDDVASTEGWTFPSVLQLGNWNSMKTNYPEVAQLANVQCENCHGPQKKGSSGFTDAHGDSANSEFESARITFSVSMCAQCHDAPTHHVYVNEWASSGHANLTLAREEATWETRGPNAAHCGRCHAGQGFVKWLPQVKGGYPGNITPFSQAIATEIGLTDALVQPQTCQTCHDPHDVTNPHQLRVYDSTPLLPAGFSASGMGSGALCMMCHNTRNGVSGTTAYLHEDNDPVFGTPTSYSAPHSYAAQSDVFMGRNAYFMGDAGTPHLSKHANVEEACVGCHMKLNPDGLHAFTIDPTKKAQLCANCHGNTTGEGLAAQVESLLAQLEAKIGTNIKGKLDAEITLDGAYNVRAWDPVTDCYSSTSSSNSNIQITQNATSVALTEIHGQMGIVITLPTPIDASGGLCSNLTNTTTVYAQLGSVVNDNTNKVKIVALNDPVVKAAWNYFLIEGGSAEGVHNPSFAVETLWQSILAVP